MSGSGVAKITPVYPPLVKDCWGEASKYLEKACDTSNGRYDGAALRGEIDCGSQTLWILYRDEDEMIGAATTGFSNYPLKRYMTVTFAGSNNESCWLKYRDIVMLSFIEWAKSNNCSGIEIVGREGWLKVLKPFDAKQSSVTIEMEI